MFELGQIKVLLYQFHVTLWTFWQQLIEQNKFLSCLLDGSSEKNNALKNGRHLLFGKRGNVHLFPVPTVSFISPHIVAGGSMTQFRGIAEKGSTKNFTSKCTTPLVLIGSKPITFYIPEDISNQILILSCDYILGKPDEQIMSSSWC